MTSRSVLLSSNYNAWPEVFNGQCYAFLNVVKGVEGDGAEILAPPAAAYTKGRSVRPSIGYLVGELSHRSRSQVRRLLGRPAQSNMQPTKVDKDHDLFMFMCQFPVELTALSRIEGWRERSGVAVCFILETWSHIHESVKTELKLLDQFDHVFVLNRECIPNLRKYTTAPLSFLATASDCLLSTPFPAPPERSIDVFSMGRRSQPVHEKLVALAAGDSDFLYVQDTMRQGSIIDWRDHRLMTANLIKRSKFFMAYDHAVVDPLSESKNFKEQALSTRYFEGAAGGAVILGSASQNEDFREYFDWEDAAIALPEDVVDLADFLADLERQQERMERARLNNAVQCLRRHDWAHRWRQILDTLGLEHPAMLKDRLELLASLADGAERTFGKGAARRDSRAVG